MITLLKILCRVTLIIFLGFLILHIFDTLPLFIYCDSESISEFVVDKFEVVNEGDNSLPSNSNTVSSLSFAEKIRRRISWYITAKNRGTYSTYDQYKEHWNPNIKLRSQIKSVILEDFKKARLNAEKDRASSDINNERLMRDIRASRYADSKNRSIKYFEAMNSSRK